MCFVFSVMNDDGAKSRRAAKDAQLRADADAQAAQLTQAGEGGDKGAGGKGAGGKGAGGKGAGGKGVVGKPGSPGKRASPGGWGTGGGKGAISGSGERSGAPQRTRICFEHVRTEGKSKHGVQCPYADLHIPITDEHRALLAAFDAKREKQKKKQ